MVFFICGQCNDSLKKVKVEAHLQRCKAPIISCCDCGREFSDDSYKKHTICVSEDQKYGPQTGNVLSPEISKGQVKQTAWLDFLKESIKAQASLTEEAERALNKLTELDNVPRKRKKFDKFLANCIRVNSPAIVDEVWKVCEQAIESMRANTSAADGNASPTKRPLDKVETEEQIDDTTGPPKKKKQRKSKKSKESESSKSETIDGSEKPQEESVEPHVDVEGVNNSTSPELAKKKQKKPKKEKNNETTGNPEQAEKENDNPPKAVETSMAMDDGGDSDKKANKKRKKSKKSKNQAESNGSQEPSQNGASPVDEKPSDLPVDDQPKAKDITATKSLDTIEKSPKKAKKAKKSKKGLGVK